jgi:hypothetical protein
MPLPLKAANACRTNVPVQLIYLKKSISGKSDAKAVVAVPQRSLRLFLWQSERARGHYEAVCYQGKNGEGHCHEIFVVP